VLIKYWGLSGGKDEEDENNTMRISTVCTQQTVL
jgi:hypothetical protein